MKTLQCTLILAFAFCWAVSSATSSFDCPVTGESVSLTSNDTRILRYKGGQKVYFCCADCFSSFVQTPYNYIQSTPAPIDPQYIGMKTICPVSQEAVTVTANTDHVSFNYGQSVFFCCPDCMAKFLENPDSFIDQE